MGVGVGVGVGEGEGVTGGAGSTSTVNDASTLVVLALVLVPLTVLATAMTWLPAFGGTIDAENVPALLVRIEGIPLADPSHVSWIQVLLGKSLPTTSTDCPTTAAPLSDSDGLAAMAEA